MTKKGPAPPRGLGARSRAFWRAIQTDYVLDRAEVELLREACRTIDAIDRLDAQVAADGEMVEGSTGQRRLHPAITEARGQRLALARLVKQLDLPGDEEEIAARAEATSSKARRAARERWNPRNGGIRGKTA